MALALTWYIFLTLIAAVIGAVCGVAYLVVGGAIAWHAFDVPPEPPGRPLMDETRRTMSGAMLAELLRSGRYRLPTPPQPPRAYRPPKTRRDDAFLLFVHAHPVGRLRKYLDGESAYGESLFARRLP
jgi:hypothetical protein